MSEFMKSMFDMFGTGAKSNITNDLIGNTIEVGNELFKISSVIAEGGFAIVFEVQNVETQKVYALKRLLSRDTDSSLKINEEISYLKKLSGHHNIIQLITASTNENEKLGKCGIEYLIVTELCTGGPVIQLMQRRNRALPFEVALQMFSHVCKAIEHMHRQTPPIIHRDLKVENLLINSNAVIKLCDFGSATTNEHYPNGTWSGQKRIEIKEEIEKHTTPMYRAPEMIDLYQNFPINTSCDIWALGCVLYYFFFNKHPFEDSATLAIINGKYNIPHTEINCDLIDRMLVVDPRERWSITKIIDEVQKKASAANITLGLSVIFDKTSLLHLPILTPLTGPDRAVSMTLHRPLPPPVPPKPNHGQAFSEPIIAKPHDYQTRQSTALPDIPPQSNSKTMPIINDGKKVFNLFKDGAVGVINKVIDQVSSSLNKTDLDLVYVTSRIIMMPTPGEIGIERLTKDNVDDVRTFLDFRHPNQYYIYNLSLKYVANDKFRNRIMHMGFDPLKPPSLNSLMILCMHQLHWLSTDPKNVIVIQCTDGRMASGMCLAALFCFCKLVNSSSEAVKIVKFRRSDCHFTPSQLRYIDYVSRIMKNVGDPSLSPDIPHNFSVIIKGIKLQPVPIFNRSRTGLRPFIEIFSDYKLVYTSLMNYNDLPCFTSDQNSVQIDVPRISVHGDMNIIVYHTRSNIVAKGKINSIKVCECQVYSGYVNPNSTEVGFTKDELDHLDSDYEKYPNGFHMKIQLEVLNRDAISYNQIQTLSWNSDNFKEEILNKMNLDHEVVPFRTLEEMEECMRAVGIKVSVIQTKSKVKKSTEKAKCAEPNENFFFTLDWGKQDENNIADACVVDGSNNYESNINEYECNDDVTERDFGDDKLVEAVGDLLGDFGATTGVQANNSATQSLINADIDGLSDFFSGISVKDKQSVKHSSNADLLGSFCDTELKNNNSLLFFESSHNVRNQGDMFDLFGQNNCNSSSTSDLTSKQTLLGDCGVNDMSGLLFNQQGQSFIKPSNSTSNLLNMKNSNQIKLSPSFHENKVPQKLGSFDNLTGDCTKPAMNIKSKVTPKQKADHKSSETADNSQATKKKDAFQDLLGDFKPSDSRSGSATNGARSIKDIRKETMQRTTDPEVLKVLDWIDGKEKNIRALLCSLPSILWSDIRWSGVNMSELVTVAQVKKAYKNAIRCVHPDKWNNSEHENLAKLIMIELNEAMSEFEAEKNACQ